MQRQKKFWVILLSAIIFLAAAILGISAVYRVDEVTVKASLVSKEAEAEVELLREQLEKAYKRESIFFANEKEAQGIMEDFPYFRLTGFEKSHPNRLIVEIIEDAEVYAVESAELGYYILGADGTLLGVRDTHVNPLNGAENVIVKGLSGIGADDEHFASVMALCKELSFLFGGIRSNVVSVEVFMRTPETIYRVAMREGVTLYFGTPSEKMEDKAQAAVNAYLSLTDEQKMTGRIVISEIGGVINTLYAEKDDFVN